jgi:hypothetical protein
MDELDSEALTREKLKLEIRELERPIWQRPAAIGATTSLFIAVVGFFAAWWTGYFDRERLGSTRKS